MQEGHVQAVECALDVLTAAEPPLTTLGVTALREKPALENAEALRGAAMANVAARMEAENFMVQEWGIMLNSMAMGSFLKAYGWNT